MSKEAQDRRLDLTVTAHQTSAMQIFKIFRAEEFAAFEAAGETAGAPVDLADGYIHFSTAEQVQETAAKHFSGEEDLVLLALEGVHAAPTTGAATGRLAGSFNHYGEPDIATKVNKINAYSSSLGREKHSAGSRFARTRMLLYPPFAFLRAYVFKRLFLNGWAGFISSVVMAFYAFLKYAKRYEAGQQESSRRDD